jgi:hypothetical protein
MASEDQFLLGFALASLIQGTEHPYVFSLLRRYFERSELLSPEIDDLLRVLEHELPYGRRWRLDIQDAARGVAAGVQAAFEQRLEQLHEHLSSLEHKTEILSSDLHTDMWIRTVGADREEVRVPRVVPLRIYISDPAPDREIVSDVVSSIESLAESLDFERADEFPEEAGSWGKRFFLRAKALLTSKEAKEKFATAEAALTATYLNKPQAEANKLQAEAAANLIKSLNHVPNACIQVGTLLVVKRTANGTPSLLAITLTSAMLKHLEEHQSLLKQPDQILERLGTVKSPGKRRAITAKS